MDWRKEEGVEFFVTKRDNLLPPRRSRLAVELELKRVLGAGVSSTSD